MNEAPVNIITETPNETNLRRSYYRMTVSRQGRAYMPVLLTEMVGL